MDKEIKRFREQNGNVRYSVKELLGALHTKLDKHIEDENKVLDNINTTLSHGAGKIASNREAIKGIKYYLTLLTTLTILTIGIVIKYGG